MGNYLGFYRPTNPSFTGCDSIPEANKNQPVGLAKIEAIPRLLPLRLGVGSEFGGFRVFHGFWAIILPTFGGLGRGLGFRVCRFAFG